MTSPPPSLHALLPGILLGTLLLTGPGVPEAAQAQSLRGSQASLDRQNHQARLHDFTYLQTPEQVRRFVELGYLVPVRPNRDMDVHNVSFPYARPEVRLFLERLAGQYRAACGEKLVVTSLTRPASNQPPNASSRSVHPTGMAVDLRRSGNARCRSWLESTLLSLEGRGLIEAIYERRPPHYHIAVYPQPYAGYVASITGNDRVVAQVTAGDPQVEVEWITHRVSRGENLTAIAARHGSTVSRIRSENGIRGSRILAGQELRIPVYREVPAPDTRVADAGATAVGSAEEARGATGAAPSESGGAPSQTGAPPSETGAPPSDSEAAPEDAGDASSSGSSRMEPATHRVRRGESLWAIARAYGVGEAELRRANGIQGNRILVGQELTIPGLDRSGETFRFVQHRVARGESLWSIARRHGTTVEDIRRHNGIGTNIQAGQVLEIPTGR
jgi:LysM repeat protein